MVVSHPMRFILVSRALHALSETGDEHIAVEAHLHARGLDGVPRAEGQARYMAHQVASQIADADQAVAVRIRLATQRLQHNFGERPVAPCGVLAGELGGGGPPRPGTTPSYGA